MDRESRAGEVLLNRFHVAGFRWTLGPRLAARMRPGDPLELCAEPDNPHDRYAVLISWMGWKIGYVPRSDNRHLSRLLRRGIRLGSEVVEVDPAAADWRKVRAAVYLTVDGLRRARVDPRDDEAGGRPSRGRGPASWVQARAPRDRSSSRSTASLAAMSRLWDRRRR